MEADVSSVYASKNDAQAPFEMFSQRKRVVKKSKPNDQDPNVDTSDSLTSQTKATHTRKCEDCDSACDINPRTNALATRCRPCADQRNKLCRARYSKHKKETNKVKILTDQLYQANTKVAELSRTVESTNEKLGVSKQLYQGALQKLLETNHINSVLSDKVEAIDRGGVSETVLSELLPLLKGLPSRSDTLVLSRLEEIRLTVSYNFEGAFAAFKTDIKTIVEQQKVLEKAMGMLLIE